MPGRYFQFYQRHRIVNVNLNIIGSGLLAVAIAKWPVHHLSEFIGLEHKLINSVVAALIDGAADIAIYFALHWFANHWRPGSSQREEDKPEDHSKFWRNATLVQFERMALTPAFYVVAIGGMWALQHTGMHAGWAFVFAFSSAIVVTRVAHTVWGLRTGRFQPLPIGHLRHGRAKGGESADPPADAA